MATTKRTEDLSVSDVSCKKQKIVRDDLLIKRIVSSLYQPFKKEQIRMLDTKALWFTRWEDIIKKQFSTLIKIPYSIPHFEEEMDFCREKGWHIKRKEIYREKIIVQENTVYGYDEYDIVQYSPQSLKTLAWAVVLNKYTLEEYHNHSRCVCQEAYDGPDSMVCELDATCSDLYYLMDNDDTTELTVILQTCVNPIKEEWCWSKNLFYAKRYTPHKLLYHCVDHIKFVYVNSCKLNLINVRTGHIIETFSDLTHYKYDLYKRLFK